MTSRASLFILSTCLTLMGLASFAEEYRRVSFKFEVCYAEYKNGDFTYHPKPYVYINVYADRWPTGPGTQAGYTKLHGQVSNITDFFVYVPNSVPRGTAKAHLVFEGSQPWGLTEEYLIWPYGRRKSSMCSTFDVETEQPAKVILVPVDYARAFYEKVVVDKVGQDVDLRDHYFVQTARYAFLNSGSGWQEKAVNQIASYWEIEPQRVKSDFDAWAKRIEKADASQASYQDKILAQVYQGHYDQAATTARLYAYAVGIVSPQKTIEAAQLTRGVNLAWSRDLYTNKKDFAKAAEAWEEAYRAEAKLQENIPDYGEKDIKNLSPDSNPWLIRDLYPKQTNPDDETKPDAQLYKQGLIDPNGGRQPTIWIDPNKKKDLFPKKGWEFDASNEATPTTPKMNLKKQWQFDFDKKLRSTEGFPSK